MAKANIYLINLAQAEASAYLQQNNIFSFYIIQFPMDLSIGKYILLQQAQAEASAYLQQNNIFSFILFNCLWIYP
ncbi:hypothetical protein [Polaribacter sp. L3A8]|uniref:hypothetical protein n=1 Tax=Polaribacter sp. L3A8 TaxID=2686361 RepID=UPI00131C6231|nr:hypothetical protein [Polaribacter sp. L3A8]